MDRASAESLLARLADVRGSVELGPVGAAAEESEGYRAYRSLEGEHARLLELRPQLELMARGGPGARRIYAALLLGKIDEPAGRAALQAMRGSDEPCGFGPGGCEYQELWLGEIASRLLGEYAPDPRRVALAHIQGLMTRYYTPHGPRFERPPELGSPPVSSDARAHLEMREQIVQLDAEALRLRPRLETVVREAPPSGRLQGALLLHALDRRAGEQALESLVGDATGVWDVGGEVERWRSVGQIARDLLPPERAGQLPVAPEPVSPAPRDPYRRKEGWFRRWLDWVVDRIAQM